MKPKLLRWYCKCFLPAMLLAMFMLYACQKEKQTVVTVNIVDVDTGEPIQNISFQYLLAKHKNSHRTGIDYRNIVKTNQNGICKFTYDANEYKWYGYRIYRHDSPIQYLQILKNTKPENLIEGEDNIITFGMKRENAFLKLIVKDETGIYGETPIFVSSSSYERYEDVLMGLSPRINLGDSITAYSGAVSDEPVILTWWPIESSYAKRIVQLGSIAAGDTLTYTLKY
jgi:5-hydroxyisourate hydrolase-like protein (transthyretin family)